MAECQENFDYNAPILDALRKSLSGPRLHAYIGRDAEDHKYTVKMYLWNARLAKALLFPLHVAEVTTRNAMHRALSRLYGMDWILNNPFGFTNGSQEAVNKTVDRVQRENVKRRTPRALTANDYVAALTLDFWSNLFREDYDKVWQHSNLLRSVFPNLPAVCDRRSVQLLIRDVNDLRNRVAHHEPILKGLTLKDQHDKVMELIGWSCQTTKRWARRHSTFESILEQKPTGDSNLPGLSLQTLNLRKPTFLDLKDNLLSAMKNVSSSQPSLALVHNAESTPPYKVIFPNDILRFIEQRSLDMDNMIDLVAHKVSSLVETSAVVRMGTIPITATTGDARAMFFPAGVQKADRPLVLLVTSKEDASEIVGTLINPDVRY
jgi:hypothetical protein